MIHSLKKAKDFEKVAKTGQPFFVSELGFKLCKNNLKYNRYGIVVNTKIDKRAVVRNKIQRRIKETIRSQDKNLAQGFDLMFLVRESVKKLNYSEIENRLLKLFKKAKLL